MPQPCYCGPTAVPIVCVERITEIIKAKQWNTSTVLEVTGHSGAVWAYIAAKLVGGPEVMNVTPEDEKLNAAALKLVNTLLGSKKDVPVSVPGFIIDLIISQVLAALIEKVKDTEFWAELVAKVLELIEQLKRK